MPRDSFERDSPEFRVNRSLNDSRLRISPETDTQFFFPTRSSTTISFFFFSFSFLRTLYANNIRLSTTVCRPVCRKSVKPSPKSLNYPPNSKCRGNFATLAPSLKLGVGQVAGNLTSNYQSKDSRERDSICPEIEKYSSLVSCSLLLSLPLSSFSKRSHHDRSIDRSSLFSRRKR